MRLNNKKIAIICTLDNFANKVRPVEIQKFLTSRGFDVFVINTCKVNRLSQNINSFLSKVPSLSILGIILYLVEMIDYLQRKLLKFLTVYVYYYLILCQMKIRALIISNQIRIIDPAFVICENPLDSYVLLNKIGRIKIYDCPVPWSDELFYSNLINEKQRQKIRQLEKKIYQNVDYLTFHWNLYSEYVKKNYYNGNNFFVLNWGCNPQKESYKAKYNRFPRIVFLGYLEGEWVNLPLLAKLTTLYPNIDVYGGPAPDKKYKLNYKGYAPTTSVLKKYQFGLITISKDKLRQNSFSSKHLEYLSFGLPVLTPDWRKDPNLNDVSLYYNENNFLDQIKKYSPKHIWQEISDKSYQKSKIMAWNKTLQPLQKIINGSGKDF